MATTTTTGGGGGGGRRRRRYAARSACCCPTHSLRCAGRRSTGRSLQKAFEAAGVDADIQNAEGDKSTQQQQAEQMITNGANVLLLVNLDSGSGAAIAANAKSQGVKVIDYDRLTLDTDATDYYVSFDNEKVGELQGQGLVDCIGDKKGADRRPERLADGQQRHAVQERLRLGHRQEVRVRRLDQGRRPVRARLGQPAGADDLRADAAEGRQQGRRRARRQRRPRQRGHLGSEAAQAAADPGDRPGRHARGHPEHRQRRSVHDRLQGDREGGRRGRGAGDRAGQGRGADRRDHADRQRHRGGPERAARAGRR